jgi:hypothetical protein
MKILITESQFNLLNEFFGSRKPKYTNFDVVAATLIGEAGGEPNPIKSMKAVLSVLLNRSKIKGTKMAVQALAPLQFSMWNGINNDPKKISAKIEELKEHSQWNNAMNLVKSPVDITHGATHYYVFKGPSAVNPDWKTNLKSTLYPAIKNPDNKSKLCTACKQKKFCKHIECFLKIGNHLFGKTAF